MTGGHDTRVSLAALIAEGFSNAGVAQQLVVTVAAVERHVTSIFDKLGLHQSPEQHRRVLTIINGGGYWVWPSGAW